VRQAQPACSVKILLFGASGQLGWQLQRSLAPLGEVVAPGRRGRGGLCGELGDLAGIAATVHTVRPDVVVNAAAYTAVDAAEDHPALAHAINAAAPGVLALAALRAGAALVHFSSDYVFDGSGSRPWHEDDTPRPLSVYGRSKLEGELRVACTLPRHLILRSGWLYAPHAANFATTMLRLARERDTLAVVDDQWGAPTSAEQLADASAHALRLLMRDPGVAGTYHVAAQGETTWHGYARFLLHEAAQAGLPLRAGAAQVQPVATEVHGARAARPRNARLDTASLRAVFGLALPPWQYGIRRLLAELRPAAR
jgi:dTDP-4-dehydrorhamnose reductase